MNNPDAVIEILQNAQHHYGVRTAEAQRALLQQHEAQLERDDAGGFVFGNPKGSLTLIEFFDYQCRFCKATFRDLITAVHEDGDVRLILREFPIFGPLSREAAKAALAAERQRHYFELHAALMDNQQTLNEARLFLLAEQAGLDTARLRRDMEDPAIEAAIEANLELARQIGVQGTPSFVSNGVMIADTFDRDSFHAFFARLRATKNQGSSPSAGELGAP